MVVLINTFEVEMGREAEFVETWLRVSKVMEARPGFIHTRLHRRLSANRFVNVAEWGSQEEFVAALSSSEFRESATPLRGMAREDPALYEVVYDSA